MVKKEKGDEEDNVVEVKEGGREAGRENRGVGGRDEEK